ncbi:hypothetical protein [Aureimonas psammosilenae]|uniref:hypothetical protein n=1 Tax=Aureimonas psammosilenae TaxID=2495496 RepID=UPI00126132B2|nr:hypothetical protein [Aureimonas psammosilenae]
MEDCGEPTCQPAAHRRTVLRFEAGLGLRIRGGTVDMQQIDLFDSWFEPDPLDDAITFRRNDDPPVLTRLVISRAAHKN